MTCLNKPRAGESKHSICPLTGRVGKAYGAICPDHAPAQLTTFAAWNEVLVVVTPLTRPSHTSTAVTSSPDETSTARCFAAWKAAVVRARGSTLRSFK